MKQIVPFLFMFLFMALIAGAHFYMSRRFGWYFQAQSLKPFYWGFALLIVYMIGGLAAFTNSVSGFGAFIYGSAAVLLGFALYLLLSTLLVDLLHFLIKVPPRSYGLAVLTLTLGISVYGIINAFSVRTNYQELELRGLEAEMRIMHWTDIHLGHFRGAGFLENLVERTNREQVDAVLITGDLFDGKVRLKDSTIQELKKLKAPAFFVAGNHDGYSGVENVKQSLRDVGVHVLSNQVEDFRGLQLVGLNHMLADEKSNNIHAVNGQETIQSVLDSLSLDPDRPSIVLHHSPDGIEYVSKKGINLYLSGHTHAGQLFPMTLIGEGMYQFNKGLHSYQDTRIFVGEGAGTFGPPMRIGTHSTVTVFDLKPLNN